MSDRNTERLSTLSPRRLSRIELMAPSADVPTLEVEGVIVFADAAPLWAKLQKRVKEVVRG